MGSQASPSIKHGPLISYIFSVSGISSFHVGSYARREEIRARVSLASPVSALPLLMPFIFYLAKNCCLTLRFTKCPGIEIRLGP